MMCVSVLNETPVGGFISAQQDVAYVKTTETLFALWTLAVPTSSLTFCHKPSDEPRLYQFPSARNDFSKLMDLGVIAHGPSEFTKKRMSGACTSLSKVISKPDNSTTHQYKTPASKSTAGRFAARTSTARVSERRDSKGSRDLSRSPRTGDFRFKKRH